MESKKCKACLEVKELSEFGNTKANLEGKLNHCKNCAKNKIKSRACSIKVKEKVCRGCLKTKKSTEYRKIKELLEKK